MRTGNLFVGDVVLHLSDEEWRVLMRPLGPKEDGWGGHQYFLAKMQQRVKGRQLIADEDELDTAYHYGYELPVKRGTWQNQSKAVVTAALRAGWKPR